MEDLDNDGYEQTGWDILYMHVAAQDRVEAGTYVYAGDRIGHPSCEGGIANASHLHLVRKYNGEWIAADGNLPFILDGWVSSGNGTEYDGYLKRGSITLEAEEGSSAQNISIMKISLRGVLEYVILYTFQFNQGGYNPRRIYCETPSTHPAHRFHRINCLRASFFNMGNLFDAHG